MAFPENEPNMTFGEEFDVTFGPGLVRNFGDVHPSQDSVSNHNRCFLIDKLRSLFFKQNNFREEQKPKI